MKVKNTESLVSYVMTELLKGRRLNQREFLVKGSWRLASIINSLKKRGVSINRRGIGGRAVEYFLTGDEIHKLKNK